MLNSPLVLKHYGGSEDYTAAQYFSDNLSTFGQVVEHWTQVAPYTEATRGWYRWWDTNQTEEMEKLRGALMQYLLEGTYTFKDNKLANSKVADYTGNSVDVVFTFTPTFTDTFETTEMTVRFVFKK